MKIFKHKTVFITGAANGMGQALAIKIAQQGAYVIATDIQQDALEQTVQQVRQQGGQIETQVLDVTDQTAFEAALQKTRDQHGSLDYLFNNAGIAIVDEVRDMPMEDWQKIIDIDQMGVLYGTLAAYRIMIEQGSGHIVNTASVAGLSPAPLLAAYSMAKHAVVGLSTSLREEAVAFGVKVSVVCPGLVRTSIADGDFSRHGHFPDPFGMLRERARLKALTKEQAADYILKGVARNDQKIIFPAHGRALVRTNLLLQKPVSRLIQYMLSEYRKNYRS